VGVTAKTKTNAVGVASWIQPLLRNRKIGRGNGNVSQLRANRLIPCLMFSPKSGKSK